jgi:hypothetical protein
MERSWGLFIQQEVMVNELRIALGLAAVVGAASAALAKDSGPPKIDIQRTCRESSSSVTGSPGDISQALNACVADEQAARKQLAKNWASYQGAAKSQCLKPQEFLPSYVEWQTCVEMRRDVEKIRRGQAGSAQAASRAPGGSSDRRSGSNSGK